MVSNGDHGGNMGLGGGSRRLFGHLKANRRVAYVLLVMVMVHLSNQYDRYLFSVSKIPFVDYDSFEFALIAGPFFTAVNSLAGVLLSFIGDVRPVRLLSTACLFWSASTGAVAFSRKFWQVALARVGQGIGDAACSPFAASILRDHFGPEFIGSAIGIYYVGLYAGFSLALGAGTLVDDLLGWKWAYLLAAMAGALVAGVTFLTVPEPLPLNLRVPQRPGSTTRITTPAAASATTMGEAEEASAMPWGDGGGGGSSISRSNPRSAYSLVGREEEGGPGGRAADGAERPALRQHGSATHLVNGCRNDDGEGEEPNGATGGPADGSARRGTAPSSGMGVMPTGGEKGRRLLLPPPPPPQGVEDSVRSRAISSRALSPHANTHPRHEEAGLAGSGPRRPRGKLSELSAAWLTSPSLLLVCVAGGVRDAGGFVFGYYLASYFSPLLDGNAALTRHGAEPCSLSFDAGFAGDQVCNDAFPWCVDGLCNRLTGSPWHDVGMSASQLEWFVSWVPLVGGSLGAMMGGFLSDRVAQRLGTAGRLWVVVVSNALASPFAVGVLLAPYPWCFICLLGVELLGEMWIGVVLAVVMALVPRQVRVTSVALYSFIITNISGLSTTLVPLLRARYDSPHTFRFLAEPLAGAAATTAAAAAAASSWSGTGESSIAGADGSGGSPLSVPPLAGFLGNVAAVVRLDGGGFGGGGGGEGGEGLVEYRVSATGSSGLRAAMLWMYPGMYVASSFFCLAAIVALGRDRRGKAAAATAAAAANEATGPRRANGTLCTERDGRSSPRTGRWEAYGSAEEKEDILRQGGGTSGVGGGGDTGGSRMGEGHGGVAAGAGRDPLLRGAGEASDSESVEAHV